MGEQQNRQCLNRLMALSAEGDELDRQQMAHEIDRMLACNGRRGCCSHLACSWLAVELSGQLAQRYR